MYRVRREQPAGLDAHGAHFQAIDHLKDSQWIANCVAHAAPFARR